MSSEVPQFNAAVKAVLERAFPEHEIKGDVRRQTDGFEPVYVEAANVIRRLNEAFGQGGWRHEIVGDPIFFPPANVAPPQQVIVRIKLSVTYYVNPIGLVTVNHEQFGCCFLKRGRNDTYIDPGGDMKAAATDGIKKCATYFGIALDLYVKDESPMQGLHRKDAIQSGQQGSFPAVQTNPNAPGEPWQIEEVKKMFSKLGVGDPDWWMRLGFSNPHEMTQGQLQSLMAGQHPWVAQLLQEQGKRPGLQPTTA